MTLLKSPGRTSRTMTATIIFAFLLFGSARAEKSAPGLDGRRQYTQAFEDINNLIALQKDPEFKNMISQLTALAERPFIGENGYITHSFLASPTFNKILPQDSSNAASEFDSLKVSSSDMISDMQYNQESSNMDVNLATLIPDLGNLTTDANTTSLPVTTAATTNTSTDTTVTSSTGSSTSVTTSLPGTVSPSPIGSTKCVKDLEFVLTGLIKRENWALRLIDSWGKPGPSILEAQLNWVGAYKECRNVSAPISDEGKSGGFDGNYCVAMITTKDSGNKTSTPTLLPGIQIGTCMPDSCSDMEITEIMNQILSLIPKGNSSSSKELIAYATDCRTDEREFTTATIFAIVFLSIIGAMMIIGTAYDLAFIQWPKWEASWKGTSDLLGDTNGLPPNGNPYHSNNYQDGGGYHQIPNSEETGAGPIVDDEIRPLLAAKEKRYVGSQGGGICGKVLLAFSVYTNGSKILGTAQTPGSLSAINGIRFLSMTWVILGHVYVFGLSDIQNILTALPELLSRWTFDAISNALFSVDTFFTLSGLLTSYLTIKEMAKKGWKINWAMFYFHRFWRLTPPYMLVLLIVLGLQRFMGSGALWVSTQPLDKTVCEENWWTNLLYINNIVRNKEMCFGHSWYLANDMQFFIVSPLMLIPFCFNKFFGLASCMIFLVSQWLIAGILSTDNNWQASLISATNPDMVEGGGKLDWMTYYYFAPYCRIGPFVVGILAGYLLASKNGKVRMKWPVVLIGWIVSIATALALLYGIHDTLSGQGTMSNGANAFYNAVSRSAWGACVCWVIIACVSGYGGPVNSLLSWAPFGPLGRMTYMAYLIHPCILYVYFGNLEKLFYITDTSMIFTFLGVLFFTYLASFVLMLGLESPMVGLEKVFLGKFRR